MARRSPETLADYLVVAIAPALIVLLVGSLMWFLVEVFYQGEHKGRLLWVMAMFVIAIVGVARISIEEGMARAAIFGWALAAAVGFVLARLVSDGLFLSAAIMILVWWAAHKLTWDCTVIDEDQDVSGQGLLQQMGLDPAAEKIAHLPPGTTTSGMPPEATTATTAEATPPWWETLLEPDRRPHAPGVWVVYFSLAALPLFGIGGWFVPAAEPARRSLVFGLLVIYVASGMGLLLATSFLGLRRYLRQRKLEMPLEMTSTWILVGIGLIFATLIVATILPRPSREYSLSQLPFTVTSAVRRASKIAFGKEGTQDDAAKDPAKTEAKEGQNPERKGTKQGKGEAGGKSAEGQKSGEAGKSQSEDGSQGDKGGKSKGSKSKDGEAKGRDAESQSKQREGQEQQQKSDEQQDKSREPEEQQQNQNANQPPPLPQGNENQAQSPPNRPNPGQMVSQLTSLFGTTLAFLIRVLFYVGLLVGVVAAAWIYREEVMAAWRKLVDELRELWEHWFGKKKPSEEAAVPAAAVAPPPRTFGSYRDPFVTGDAQGMSWPQLVRYSFEALEAWGRERDCPRQSGQTPHEFALALAGTQPRVASGVQTLANWYGQLAYAAKGAPPDDLNPLRQLWAALRAN